MKHSPLLDPTDTGAASYGSLIAGVSTSAVAPTEFAYTTTTMGNPLFHLETLPQDEATWVETLLKQLPPCRRFERFFLVEGSSQYGALNCFTHSLAKVLEYRGHQCRIVNVVDNPNTIAELTDIIQNYQPTVILGFNGMHESVTLGDGLPIGQVLNIPSISWMVDHHLMQLLRVELQNYTQKINAYAIVDGMESTLNRVLLKENVSMHVPLRVGGYPDFKAMQPFRQRDNRILVPSSFTPYHVKREDLRQPEFPELEALCFEAVDYLIASPEHPADTFLMDGLEALGLELHDIHPSHWQHLYTAIHHSSEMYWREHLLKAARNIPLRLYGRGWEAADFISDQWEVHGIEDPNQRYASSTISEWYGRSQTIWNIFPAYPATGHDRIYFATANGCNVITERKAWLYEAYGETLSYLPQDLTNVEENLTALLQRPLDIQEAQANAAQKRTLEAFTWFNCLGDIEAILQRYHLREMLSVPKVS
jgi:hypothetical protein